VGEETDVGVYVEGRELLDAWMSAEASVVTNDTLGAYSAPMSLQTGTLLGPYEILSPLGSGGMGEVYRARDTRLGRDVALKTLPDHLATNPEARERFEREAKAISSLSHPNICTLHDVGTQNDVAYLVMELIEGETLMSRLTRGAMKLDEALRVAIQIADALDRAHRSRIVHRDLKPANVMLTKSGAKILDFGVAKLREGAASPAPGSMGMLPTATPTRAAELTTEGAIIGTMQYMAPEQLEGKSLDHRADLFSFGAVLYEMLTGQRAFDGKSQASVIAAILEREPRPVSEIISASPVALDRTIHRCLAKDPDERWQSALDVRCELEWIAQSSAMGEARVAAPASQRRAHPWAKRVAAVAGASAMIALGWVLHRPAPADQRLMRASIVLPTETTLDTDNASIALSPDGTKLDYAGRERSGPVRLFVRSLDSLTSQALAGTDGASYPFWSPDGRYIGFFADRKLKKTQSSGGAVQSICEAGDGRGASWGADDIIVFAPRPRGGLQRVSASGGAPVAATTPTDDETTHRNPRFLPDGRKVLFFSGKNLTDAGNGIYSLDLATSETALVLAADSEGIFVEPGHLAFVRDGSLMVQKIDPDSVHTTGDATPIAENVQFNTFRYTGTYTFSRNGLLLYQTGAIQGDKRLTWFDLDGKRLGTIGEPAIFWVGMSISPDAQRAVATVRQPSGGSDLWMYDFTRGIGSRFTLGETNGLQPVWSPDGRQIAYVDGSGSLYVKNSDGASAARLVAKREGGAPFTLDWHPDGKNLLFLDQGSKSGTDLWLLSMTGEPKPSPFIAGPANESAAEFSQDGRWIAYVSDESGREELYVASFPGLEGRWQVSTGGGNAGGWLGGSREIWYADLEDRTFAVPLTTAGTGLVIGAPRPLFNGDVISTTSASFTPDGKRLLAAVPVSGSAGPALTLVMNWAAALTER